MIGETSMNALNKSESELQEDTDCKLNEPPIRPKVWMTNWNGTITEYELLRIFNDITPAKAVVVSGGTAQLVNADEVFASEAAAATHGWFSCMEKAGKLMDEASKYRKRKDELESK